jgi:hypothetical protein
MIIDRQNQFSDAQAITVAVTASTDSIDFGVAQLPKNAKKILSRDMGKGNRPEMRIQVVETFNNLTSLLVELQVDDTSAFGSPVTVLDMVIPLAGLTRGAVILPQMLPRGVNKRHMRVRYTVTGTNPTLGKITAALVFGNEERDV